MIDLLKDGYEISHRGVLVSRPLPSAAEIPFVRAFFLALEGTFTYLFWSMYSTKWNVPLLKPSNLDRLEYRGLNSHSPLTESRHLDGVNLTPEELEAAEAARIECVHVLNREYQIQNGGDCNFCGKPVSRRSDLKLHESYCELNPNQNTGSLVASSAKSSSNGKEVSPNICKSVD